MKHAVVRNFALFGGLLLSGTVCVMAAPYLMSPRGALGPTVLQAESPISALIAVVVCVGIAAVVATFVGRFTNSAVGLFVLGAGVFVLAGRLATISELVLSSAGSRSALLWVAVETLLWAVLCCLAVIAVFKFAGPLADVHPREGHDSLTSHLGPRPSAQQRLLVRVSVDLISHMPIKGQGAKSLLAALLMLPVVWVIARSPMKGQVIGATFAGAMVVGLVGRLVAPNTQPVLLFVAPIVIGAIGHLIGIALLGERLEIAWVTGELSAFSLPMPVDYAAGSLMGVAVGVGWAKSFLHHEETADAKPAA